MSELYVTSLSGQMEMLTGYKKDTLAITEHKNGEYSLSLELIKTDKNSHAYDLVQEEAKIECDDQEFTIKSINEKSIGSGAIKSVQAEHVFFGLIDDYFYDQLIENEYTIDYLLSRIFSETDYTYSVQGSFQPHFFEAFGAANVLSLVNLICETFGVELERDNKHVIFKNKIGNIIDFQFRYKHNTKTISKSVNTNNLSTVIVGYADVDQYGIYHVEATYKSPLFDVYGERHAEPVYADDLVLESSLMQRLQDTINDTPEISYSLEFVELKKNGFPLDNFELGDTVYTIWEPLGIDIQTRIIACTRYPMSNKSPVVTLANHQAKATDILADFSRTKQNFEKIITTGGKVKFTAMEDAIKRATVALNNSMTQLEYPEDMGIIARDPNNPNKFVVFKSNGIGITEDGGQTFKEAITADGFVLSAGVIGQLTADNIDTEGLSVKAELIAGTITGNTIEGAVINGGVINGTIINTDENVAVGGYLYVGKNYSSGQISFGDSLYSPSISGNVNGLMIINGQTFRIQAQEIFFMYRTDIDFAKTTSRNLNIKDTIPEQGVEGHIIYDADSKKLKFHDGTTWKTVVTE